MAKKKIHREPSAPVIKEANSSKSLAIGVLAGLIILVGTAAYNKAFPPEAGCVPPAKAITVTLP